MKLKNPNIQAMLLAVIAGAALTLVPTNAMAQNAPKPAPIHAAAKAQPAAPHYVAPPGAYHPPSGYHNGNNGYHNNGTVVNVGVNIGGNPGYCAPVYQPGMSDNICRPAFPCGGGVVQPVVVQPGCGAVYQPGVSDNVCPPAFGPYSPIPCGGGVRPVGYCPVNNGPNVALGVHVVNGHVGGNLGVQYKNVGFGIGVN
jgi:hypothetical protein